MIRPLAGFLERRSAWWPPPKYLRPPGALDEASFLETCHRSGRCIAACPVGAIRWLHRPDEDADETPVVDPDLAACVLCDTLACTQACMSGALLPVADARMVQMGMAVVDPAACLGSKGNDCRICVEVCPLGESALRPRGAGPPEVMAGGCVGCGLCQQHCPTSPKAIIVRPR